MPRVCQPGVVGLGQRPNQCRGVTSGVSRLGCVNLVLLAWDIRLVRMFSK